MGNNVQLSKEPPPKKKPDRNGKYKKFQSDIRHLESPEYTSTGHTSFNSFSIFTKEFHFPT